MRPRPASGHLRDERGILGVIRSDPAGQRHRRGMNHLATVRCLAFAVLTSFVLALSAPAQEGATPGSVGLSQPGQRIAMPTGPTDVTRSAALESFDDGLGGGGQNFRCRFAKTGMTLEPALGAAVANEHYVTLRPTAVVRGGLVAASLPASAAPARSGTTARYQHAPGLVERYEVTPEHVALSWVFDERPAGDSDLVVRYALDTNLPDPEVDADGGLAFVIPGVGGVRIGGVTGVAADGATAMGDVRWQPGVLELVLPARFVDEATYPLVLDPAIGPIVTAGTTVTPIGETDVAYDATTDRFLIVYLAVFSASNYEIRAQRVDTTSQLVGNYITVANSGLQSSVCVANLDGRDRFGIAFRQVVGNTFTVQFAAVTGSTVSHTSQLAVSSTNDFSIVDIGCDVNAPNGSSRGFVAVWEDDNLDRISGRRVYFAANDVLLSPLPFTVFADGGFTVPYSYHEPAISRAGSDAGDLLVVARYWSGLGPVNQVRARTVSSDGSAPGPIASVHTTTGVIDGVTVDGYGGRWVIAWEDPAANLIPTRSVRADPMGPGLLLGTVVTPIGGARQPALGYTPGRTWLGYRLTGISTSLRIEALDSVACTTCNDVFNGAAGSSQVAISTTTSGGATDREHALATWRTGLSIYCQLLRSYGTGSLANLGGACGNAGSQSFSHVPGIGSSGLVCTLSGLPPTALLTVFNFSPVANAVPCGPCQWTPFQVTSTPPIVGGSAAVEFPIPCLVSLVSLQFETQWTTLDLSQVPCPQFPGIVLSERQLLTLGQ
mgnify:FL=1